MWNVDSWKKDIRTVLGEVFINPNNTRYYGLRNKSAVTWRVNLPDGRQKTLSPGENMPIKKGFVIDCTDNANNTGLIV